MARLMKISAACMLLLTAAVGLWNHLSPSAFLKALAITLGTISYHLTMRLAVGTLINSRMHNRADLTNPWYRVSGKELRFYEKLGLHRWKGRLPTYDPDAFDRRNHSWPEIAQATAQAEVVHEVIIPFSLLPVLAGFRFGAWPVFILTSIAAAGIDLLFAILQRYNRPRILALVQRLQEREARRAQQHNSGAES